MNNAANRHNRIISRIIIGLIALSLVVSCATVPTEALARKSGKTKYSVKITNLKNKSAIIKGSKYKIKWKAVRKKGRKVKKTSVRFKSSNKKIATVSKKGVIKAKKKGTVKITVYCARKPKVKKVVKIKVTTPVKKVTLSGVKNLRLGRSATIKAKVYPSSAYNKSLTWKSSNPKVITVNKKGVVRALSCGTATVYATAKDGSKVKGSIKVSVQKYGLDSIKWIAHRGLHTEAIENTAAAFEAAGEASFWGCECDVYETKHIEAENSEGIEAEGTEEEGTEEEPAEDFAIVINHDDTFSRTMGLNRNVRDMTEQEIRDELPDVCFLDEYLEICDRHGMVPIIEFKDSSMSDEAIQKTIDMVYDLDQGETLRSAELISFSNGVLRRVKAYCEVKLEGETPYIGYLVGRVPSEKISIATREGYTGINIAKALLTEEVQTLCENNDLQVGVWTYTDDAGSDEYLYQHLLSGRYRISSATMDYLPY